MNKKVVSIGVISGLFFIGANYFIGENAESIIKKELKNDKSYANAKYEDVTCNSYAFNPTCTIKKLNLNGITLGSVTIDKLSDLQKQKKGNGKVSSNIKIKGFKVDEQLQQILGFFIGKKNVKILVDNFGNDDTFVETKGTTTLKDGKVVKADDMAITLGNDMLKVDCKVDFENKNGMSQDDLDGVKYLKLEIDVKKYDKFLDIAYDIAKQTDGFIGISRKDFDKKLSSMDLKDLPKTDKEYEKELFRALVKLIKGKKNRLVFEVKGGDNIITALLTKKEQELVKEGYEITVKN